jgi:hypothetical protein
MPAIQAMNAMMWNALIQSYMSTHHLATYAFEHLFYVLNRRLWQDSVS